MSAAGSILVLLLCLGLGAFFAGMETGMVSLNRLRLQHLVRRNVPSAILADRLLRRPEVLLGTTLIGTNLCYVILSVFSTRLATRAWGSAGPFVASAVLTLVVLVGCEYLPKAWFQSYPARRVLRFVRILNGFARLVYPLSWVLHQMVLRLFPSMGDAPEAALVTREELIHLTGEGRETGMLSSDESRMIRGVFSLSHRTCGTLMIPLHHVVVLSHTAGIDRIQAVAREHGFSRYPVRHEETGAFIGILHMRDVLRLPDGAEGTAESLGRSPLLVHHRTPVSAVLPRMRATGSPLMLVTGDAREVQGIITLEEVLAEIVSGI